MLFNEVEIAIWSLAIRKYFTEKIKDVPKFELELLYLALASKDFTIKGGSISIQTFTSYQVSKYKQFNEIDYKNWHQINKDSYNFSLSDLNSHYNKLSQVSPLLVAALS